MFPDHPLIPIDSYEIDPHPNYTLFKLHTKNGTIPLYTASAVNDQLNHQSNRPVTHDIISGLVEGFNLKILKCTIDHMENSIYYAKLFVHRSTEEIVSIDVRPSDVLILLRHHRFPLYITQKVLDLSKG